MSVEPLRLFDDAPAPDPADGGASRAPAVEIRVSSRRRKTVAAHWEGDDIVVVVPQRLPKRERQAFADELAAKLVAERERRRPTDASLTERAGVLSTRYLGGRAVPSAVTWSSRQGSRWGSCSPADRTIRISDRLKGVPDWVLDTVIVHELAHLICAEHSAEFRALVARHPRTADSELFLAGYALGLDR
ncbi:MAG TPA: M48 family metallopeptidase [Acidimicrobiales bacterium]|nr:M48 family metallopeptidase [Acidimicrobiales bacterium]